MMATLLFPHGQHEDLPGGRVRTTLGIKPVHYFANGLWRPITSRLGNSGDPAMTIGVDELAQFRIRDRLSGDAPLLHFGKGNSFVRFTPLGTANVTGRSFGENGFEYPGAWPGADLRFLFGGHRLQEDILLSAGHPAQFQFRIDSHAGLNQDTLETPEFRILAPVLIPLAGKPGQSVPLTWRKSTLGGKLILTVTLPPGDWSGWTLDPTLTLQPDPTDGLDTWIRTDNQDLADGISDEMNVGHTPGIIGRSFLKFDFSNLPSSATILSSILSLFCSSELSNNARTLRIFRMKRAWVELQATWNVYSTGNSWQTVGGFGANDCEQTAIGSRAFSATETINEFKDFTLTAGAGGVQDMIPGGSFTNNGFLNKADTENEDLYSFASSDHATAANRPKLVVEYTLPSKSLTALTLGLG